MNYYFPIHLDGGNRGCEGIAKGTAILLESQANNNLGLCRDIVLDSRLGLSKYFTLFPSENLSIFQKLCRTIEVHATKSIEKRVAVLHKYDYINFFKSVTSKDIVISTGGDMMCYSNNQVIYTNNLMHERGVKTILWGCSMGPENLTPEKEDTLHKFSLVYARESLTYDFFKSIGLKNVCLFPDPAFVLEPEQCNLPECFSESEVIGINLSNYVLGDFSLDTSFGKEVVKAINYILNETKLKILLVAHVLWEEQDDRKVAKLVTEEFGNSKRISVLDSNNLNYCQIRYVIGKCKYFIGARTHAVISAYSMCVPTIALGYSIKSKGIAKDLGLSEKLVVDSKRVKENQLVESLEFMIENNGSIGTQLKDTIPEYKAKAFGIRRVVSKL